MSRRISRRSLLVRAAEASLVAAAGRTLLRHEAKASVGAVVLSRVDSLPTGVTRTWLAPQYWANRVGDWRLADGRIEALTAGSGGRTVGVLTRQIATGDVAGSISVRTGTLSAGPGFSGFLVGAGRGVLDWRASALVMAASGEGGGFLATYDSDGNVRFREHTDENHPFAFTELAATGRSGPAPARTLGEDVVLLLEIAPTGGNLFTLTLTARRFSDGLVLSQATRTGTAEADLIGGISLISTPRAGTTARHWFRELQTGGAKVSVQAHQTGPILGTLYSLSGSVLKLSAQFMPIGTADPQQATLQRRSPGTTTWTTMSTVAIGVGFLALFRVTGWDASQDWQYRVRWAVGTAQEADYSGTVRADPTAKTSLAVALVNCTTHTFRRLDVQSSGAATLPGEAFRGLYTDANLYFPYAELLTNVSRHKPDLVVALGDQYYEDRPTVKDLHRPILDVLSRYYLWLWSFGQITRNTPTICLVDDHDMYQGNLWGWSGRAAPRSDWRKGGYVMNATWVNQVQRIQCSHNPDAYDPTPVLQGITVYYAAFSYGGVSFAVLEDRKFKNTNETNTDQAGNPLPLPRELLGPRQERFLQAWTAMHPGQPKVCLTQTVFATVQTDPSGVPQRDPDTNGAPVPARRTAIQLLKDAHAVILSGDQHLASLVRHGINTFTDGPIQFSAPAAGTAWQRWFEPASPLPNATGPNTGDLIDGYGNKLRVLAVANPKITFAQVRAVQPTSQEVGDRHLKREGYGIARIDKSAGSYRLECWPWQTDPTVPGAAQYAGWPYTLPFAQA
jgi:alkaline phosphatase D